MAIPSVDLTTLNNLSQNLDVGDVADPALRLQAFQYIYNKLTEAVADLNAFQVGGAIKTVNLADGSVVTVKLADNAVTGPKILDGAIITAKLADGNVTTLKIADGNITEEKLANKSVSLSKLGDDAKNSANHTYSGNVPAKSTTKEAIDDLYTRMTGAIGNASFSEVVDARNGLFGSNATLKQRLDGEMGLLSFDLNAVETQSNNLNTEVNTARKGRPALGDKIDDLETQSLTSAVDASRIVDRSITATKIKVATDADKIGLAELKQEVLQTMAGSTPVGTTPTDGSVTTVKVADGAVTLAKASFSGDLQSAIYYAGNIFIRGVDGTTDLIVDFETNANTSIFHKFKGGFNSVNLVTRTYTVPHNSALIYNATASPTNLTIKNMDTLVTGDVVLMGNHNGMPKGLICYAPNVTSAISEFIYYSGIMQHSQASTVDVNGVKDLTVSFSTGGSQSIFLKSASGKIVKSMALTTMTYAVPSNNALVWRVGTNSGALTVKHWDNITYGDYVLIANYGGTPKVKRLSQQEPSKGMFSTGLYYARNIVSQQQADGSIKINFLGTDNRLFYKSSEGIESITLPQTQYTIPHNNVLVWSKFSGSIVVKDYDTVTSADLILISNHSGFAKSQYLSIEDAGIPKAYQTSSKERIKLVETIQVFQEIVQVGEELWVFYGAKDDHTLFDGTLRIYDKNTFQLKSTINHNIGHVNSADYNPNNDCLIIGNNTASGAEVPPAVFIFYNVSSWRSLQQVDFNAVDKTIVNFNGSGRELGGFGITARPNACWGEPNRDKQNIIYLVMNDNSNVYKVLLGMGSNDYSYDGVSADDKTRWGAFATTVPERYNGTAKIVTQYLNPHNYGVNQGIAYHDGKLYVGASQDKIMVNVYQLVSNGSLYGLVLQDSSNVVPIYNDAGNIVSVETEGVTILDGIYLLQGYYGESNGIAITPLGEMQAGTGIIQQRVEFMFKGNSKPVVQITPTSQTTDLYISSIDSAGFTVSSKSGGNGGFNWSSNIT